MQTIIAAVDSSDTAYNAAFYAADLARSLGAGLTLMTAVTIPVYGSELPIFAQDVNVLEASADSELVKLQRILEDRTEGLVPIATEVRYGMLSQHLMDMAIAIDPLFIIVGLDDYRGPLMSANSHCVSAAYHLPCPVLVIPANAPFHFIKTVAVACDLTQPEDTLPMKWLDGFLSSIHPHLHIVNVCTADVRFDAVKSETALYIQKHLARFNPVFHFLKGKYVEEELATFCRANEIDLLVIVPKKHGLMDLLDAKHAGKIMYSQHIPTLAIR